MRTLLLAIVCLAIGVTATHGQEYRVDNRMSPQFTVTDRTFTVRVIPSPDVVQRAGTLDTVHLISAARVVDCNLNELTPWRVSVDLDKDIRGNQSITSFTVDANNAVLRLDGVPYSPQGMLPGFDPSLEILMWYSLNYPVKARQNADSSVDLVSMQGAEREAYMRGVKSRHVIGPWVEPESTRYNNPSIQECRTRLWKPVQQFDPRTIPLNTPTVGYSGAGFQQSGTVTTQAPTCVNGQCSPYSVLQPSIYTAPAQSWGSVSGGGCANGQCSPQSSGGFFRRR